MLRRESFRLLLVSLLSLTTANLFAQELQRFTFEEPHMGTLFRITLYAEEPAAAKRTLIL
jgi:hypothetical protein